MKYLFGPVISRRLGISLGIDLLPLKTCSLDCVYCECRSTTNLTSHIYEYVPTNEVIAELQGFLRNKPELDVITFSGSGEPTLHSGIGKIVDFLKNNFPEYKISILTNSTLLHQKEVMKSILNVDIIVPSLDAVSEDVFKKISRPARDITPEKLIQGLIDLRREFKNLIVLEIFIIPGLNDTEKEIGLIKNACVKISPDLIQLNTLDRPGTEKWIRPASAEKLQEIKNYFQPFKIEIVDSSKEIKKETSRRFSDISEAVIATISRRPSTLEDLSGSFGISKAGLLNILDFLLKKGVIIKEENFQRGIFYRTKTPDL